MGGPETLAAPELFACAERLSQALASLKRRRDGALADGFEAVELRRPVIEGQSSLAPLLERSKSEQFCKLSKYKS